MSEKKWVVLLRYTSGVLGFASTTPTYMTTRLKDAKVWNNYDDAKQERDMVAARLQPMKRRQISVITYDDAVARVTAKEISDG